MNASNDSSTARLGTALLRNFYTIYDQKNKRMGFASLTSQKLPKSDPVKGERPTIVMTTYAGDYKLRVPVSALTMVLFSLLGIGSIALTSALLYIFIIKNDSSDEVDDQTIEE